MVLIQRDLKVSQARAQRTGVRGEAKAQQPRVQRAAEEVTGSVREGFLKVALHVFVCVIYAVKCVHVYMCHSTHKEVNGQCSGAGALLSLQDGT